MAITNFAGITGGLRPPAYFTKSNFTRPGTDTGRYHSTWLQSGTPAAGAENATINGVALTAPITGQLPWADPTSGNTYLARLQASMGQGNPAGAILLCDRLWHNGNIDATGASSPQTISSPTWPARDALGGTNGVGVFLGLEVGAGMGNGTPQVYTDYTNSSGSAITGSAAVTGTFVAGQNSEFQSTFFPMMLAPGDVGVKSVQKVYVPSSWTSGTINLVAYRPIAILGTPQSYIGRSDAIDAVNAGMPQMFNGSVPFFLVQFNYVGGASAAVLIGELQYAQG